MARPRRQATGDSEDERIEFLAEKAIAGSVRTGRLGAEEGGRDEDAGGAGEPSDDELEMACR